VSSSYFEGSTCPLARRGYNRDGKKGKLQVNYGLLTDPRGCPVAVSVHEGNTAAPTTLMPQVTRLREAFAITELVMVGDRGMISQKAITELRTHDDGTPAHSFSTLLAELSTIVCNACRSPQAEQDAPSFATTTLANAKQQRAMALIRQISM
jgi:transposase